ncbi:hypothetical protein [Kitasatospora terrestris]|uniref:Uncharacterized protein n=1 Tax=Kitasatospora terrestris TaxID=258051 RepID=A0ABP9D7I7_9ACTN
MRPALSAGVAALFAGVAAVFGDPDVRVRETALAAAGLLSAAPSLAHQQSANARVADQGCPARGVRGHRLRAFGARPYGCHRWWPVGKTGSAMVSLFRRLDEEEAIVRGELNALREKLASAGEPLAPTGDHPGDRAAAARQPGPGGRSDARPGGCDGCCPGGDRGSGDSTLAGLDELGVDPLVVGGRRTQGVGAQRLQLL